MSDFKVTGDLSDLPDYDWFKPLNWGNPGELGSLPDLPPYDYYNLKPVDKKVPQEDEEEL